MEDKVELIVTEGKHQIKITVSGKTYEQNWGRVGSNKAKMIEGGIVAEEIGTIVDDGQDDLIEALEELQMRAMDLMLALHARKVGDY